MFSHWNFTEKAWFPWRYLLLFGNLLLILNFHRKVLNISSGCNKDAPQDSPVGLHIDRIGPPICNRDQGIGLTRIFPNRPMSRKDPWETYFLGSKNIRYID